MEELNLFRSVKLSPLTFDQETGELYYSVEFKFFPDVKQSLRETQQKEHEIIGEQLIKAFIACRKNENEA